MGYTLLLCFLLVYHPGNAFGQAYYAKILHHELEDPTENSTTSSCNILETSFLMHYGGTALTNSEGVNVEFSCPRQPEGGVKKCTEADPKESLKIIKIYGQNRAILKDTLSSLCPAGKYLEDAVSSISSRKAYVDRFYGFDRIEAGPEIRQIVNNGDPNNRIDIVIMGDGYDASEKKKFFQDVNRFVQDIFVGVALRSYLPLLNIWALYVESKESGIGYDEPKNTPFRLHRAKGKFEDIYTENAHYARRVCRVTGENACDVPCILANDDYYGGSGGEFVIFTRSLDTGRQGMWYALGNAVLAESDEYPHVESYFGGNLALSWSHWLSGEKREERAMWRILGEPWADLNEGPAIYPFHSDGQYSRWQLTVSVMGAERDDSIKFLLDGEPLKWKSKGYSDRAFYSWTGNEGLPEGLHFFSVHFNNASRRPCQVITPLICHVTLHELGNETEYHLNSSYVSAYPAWEGNREKTFRPTSGGCVRRNRTHDRFCAVCQEGIWLRFLSKVSIIDDLTLEDDGGLNGSKKVTLKTLQLGQFRPAHLGAVGGEHVEIKWLKEDVEQKELGNKSEIRVVVEGEWAVEVRFVTPEVRKDPSDCLKRTWTFDARGVRTSGGIGLLQGVFVMLWPISISIQNLKNIL